jgi:small subunit ribosomal protein S5
MNKHSNRRQKEVKEFDETVIQIDRVTRVVKGGRRLRFRATVCIGNRNGKVGIGLGKSNEVKEAIQKGIAKAKKNMVNIPLDNGTVPHDVKVKFKSSKILLMPAAEGTGVIAGGAVRKVLELAGVKNILSKSIGSDNRVNNAKATVEGLRLMRVTPKMEMADRKNKTVVTEDKKEAKPKAKKETAEKAPAKKKESKKDNE